VTTSDSLGEIRATLALVAEQLHGAQQYVGIARRRIDEAVGVLTELGLQHAEPLPPPQLKRAADELERGSGLIGAGALVVADIGARL
jgi:hypothetical protein